ncbi:sugar phosphate isomerase/epimerase [Rhizobium sp. LCM 4573]|uniref:sugar phosphate isomerase/epimerase family protein n=1 Tax=Rhizobium sp. LCM 4573 TaxID=1848291 RepID=UPI0008DAFE99|nr:sugar phosphate isomerase/epimerase family protein [Rhizobium sp. LCM 4573]OHV77114.1 hypothetical protein LCM4573_10110 [Rhizobium sp. LCM 4573]
MKLAVSNIAWPVHVREEAYSLLQAHDVNGLEIAPALFLDKSIDPFEPTDDEIAEACEIAHDAGLQLVSMQSLLFGCEGAALFESDPGRARFCDGMKRAISLAERLSIPNLVFGSPRQRNIPADITQHEAAALALEVFHELGDLAHTAKTRLGIEFNPTAYGTNFLNTADEVFLFVERLNHPAVSIILDVGAMHINGDFDHIEAFAQKAATRISHVHFSEPQLAPAPADAGQAARVITALSDVGYEGWYSIEMKSTMVSALSTLDRSLTTLRCAVAEIQRRNA